MRMEIRTSLAFAEIWTKKRKGGKMVTVIMGIKNMPEALKKFKGLLNCGGTIKDSTIILQGDHQRRLERMRDGIC